MSLRNPGPVLRSIYRAPTRLYEKDMGWLLTGRLCQITHIGRKSGRMYQTVVEVVGHNPETGAVTVVSGYGGTADWYRNVTASGSAEIHTGSRHFPARVRELTPDEAADVMAGYEHRYRFAAPLVHYGLTKLVGWNYDGSDEAIRRFVTERPMVSFTPDDQ